MAISRTTRPALRTSRVGVAQKKYNMASANHANVVKEAQKGCATHSCVNVKTEVHDSRRMLNAAKSNLKAEQKRARSYAKKK